MSDEHRRAALAERAARAGGVVAREDFRVELPVETKSGKNDLVTQADRDAQQQVLATILQEFPNDTIVCEEEARLPVGIEDPTVAEVVPDVGDAWVVDPIDGTANFVRGLPTWTTAVAAVVDGEPVGAATYFPVHGDAYTAGPDSVTRDGEPLSVSDRDDPETFAVALIGWWPSAGRDDLARTAHVAGDRFGDVRRVGSMQAALAYVAAGSFDAAFMPTSPHPWDSIAGAYLVERAGGAVTDLQGDRWTSDSQGLVVSNGTAHGTVLDVARTHLDE